MAGSIGQIGKDVDRLKEQVAKLTIRLADVEELAHIVSDLGYQIILLTDRVELLEASPLVPPKPWEEDTNEPAE